MNADRTNADQGPMLTAPAVPENSPSRRRLVRRVVKTGRTSVAGRMLDRTAGGWMTQATGCVRAGTGCRVPRLCPGARGRSPEPIDPALVNPD